MNQKRWEISGGGLGAFGLCFMVRLDKYCSFPAGSLTIMEMRKKYLPKGAPQFAHITPCHKTNINQATGGSKRPTRASSTAWRLPRQKQSKSQRLLRLKKGAEKKKKSNQDVHKSWRMVYDFVPSRLGDVFGECNVMAFSTMFTVYCLFAFHQDT